MGCCSSKPSPEDQVRSNENFRDGYTAQEKLDAPAPVAKGSELSSTYRNSEAGSVNSAFQKQQPQQTRDPSSLGKAHASPKKQEQALPTPSAPVKQRKANDVPEDNQGFCAGSVGSEDARKKSLAPSGPDKPILPAQKQQQSDTRRKRGFDRSKRSGSGGSKNWAPSFLLQAAVAGPAVAVLQGLEASVGAARSHRRRLEQLYGLCEVAVNSLVQACISLSPAPSQATTAVNERLVNSTFWRDAHDGIGSTAASSGVPAAAAAAAAAAVKPPTTPRHLRAAAEALAAELVKITALADSRSPRGFLERLGAAWVSSEALLGVWGKGEMKEEGVEFDAAEDRLRYILGRINETRGNKGRKAVKGSTAKYLRRGKSMGEPFCFERQLDVNEGGKDWARMEAFRKEFVERVEDAGGLRELIAGWDKAGKLEAAFKAWVGETGQAPLNVKAEIERVASLVEVLVDPLLSQRGQHQQLSQPPQSQQRSRPHPASLTPPMIPNGSSSNNSSGSAKKYNTAIEEGIHRPLPRTAEPPIGAPLRPRHYVCRERLSSLAAAALLRGSGTVEGSGTTLVFAGSSGAGKACLAAEVVTRRDVRAKFGDAVVWLQVGRSGGADSAVFLRRLAHAYHKVVLSKRLRHPPSPPPVERFGVSKGGKGDSRLHHGATTTVPVEIESSDSEGTSLSSWFLPYTVGLGLRCLVVLEDVSDPDVVTCASAAGFDIVVTTGVRDLLPDCPPLCTRLEVGGLSMEEARSLLRRCSGLDSKTALPPSADSVIKACGALALPLAIAGSLPAVRCRSDEAAWSNLYSILSHKATRLEESRGSGNIGISCTTATGGSSSNNNNNVGSSREHRRGRSSSSAPMATWVMLPPSRAAGTGSGGGSGGGVTGKGGTAVSSGVGGSGTESVGSAAGGQSSPLFSGSSNSNSSSGVKDSTEPPPWVGAVLWASLHALPQGHADQYLALAALPSCLRGAPGATPSAAGAKGAAGGAGIPHLAALWSIAGVGGTGGSIGGASSGSMNNGDGGVNHSSHSADVVYDEEEAKATVEMLVSRSLLLLRRSSTVVASDSADGGVKSAVEEAQQLVLPSASGPSSSSSSPSKTSDPSGNLDITASKSSNGHGGNNAEGCNNTVGDDSGGNTTGVRSRGSSYWEHGRVGEEGQRYAMHALQAAYVRSAARQRLDLMKTLGPRREAALGVRGGDGVSAAEAAAQEAAASGGTSRGSSPGRVYLRDAALLARDSSNGRGSGGIYTPRSLGHSSPASSTEPNKPGRGTKPSRGPSPMGTPASSASAAALGGRHRSPATLAAAVMEATGPGSRVGVSSVASPEPTGYDSSSSNGYTVGGGGGGVMGQGDGGCYSSSLDGEGSDTTQESCVKETEAAAAEEATAVAVKEAMEARGATLAGEAPVAWAWPGETGGSKSKGFGFVVGGRGTGGRFGKRPDVNQRLVAARAAARGMAMPQSTSGSGSGNDNGTNLGDIPETVPGTVSVTSPGSRNASGARPATVPETVRVSGSGNGGGASGRAGYAAPLAGKAVSGTAKKEEHHAAAAAAAAAAAVAAADVAVAGAAVACEEAEVRRKELRRNAAPLKATRAFAAPPRPFRRANSTASGSSTYSYSTGSENGSGAGGGFREESGGGGGGGGGMSIARDPTSTPGRSSSSTPRMVKSLGRDRRYRHRRGTERSANRNHDYNHVTATLTTGTGSTSSRESSTTSGGSTRSRTSSRCRREKHQVEEEGATASMTMVVVEEEKEGAVDRDSDSTLLDGGAGGTGQEMTAEKRRRQQRRLRRRQERLQQEQQHQQQRVVGAVSSSSSSRISRQHGRSGWDDRSEEQKTKAALEDALDSTTLGDLWFERGELDEARHEHMRALKIRMARLRHGHPDIAESLESLGNVAIREGNHLEAEGLHRRALEMRTRELGPSHLDVAATLNNLAVSLKGQSGRLPEAEAVCAHALSIVEENESRGMKAPNLKAALLKLKSKIIKRLGRRVEAADLRAKAIAIMQAAAEPSTPGALDVAPKP